MAEPNDLMIKANQLLILFLCATALYGAVPASAVDDWQAELALGDKLDMQKKNADALSHYKLALQALHGGKLNERAEVQSLIALELVRLRRLDEAAQAVDRVCAVVKQLRLLKQLSDRVIYSLTSLLEECQLKTQESKMTKEQRKALYKLTEKLYLDCIPESITVDKCCGNARGFIGGGDIAGALKYMQNLSVIMRGRPVKMEMFKLRVAALKNGLGDTAEMKQLYKDLASKEGIAQATYKIGTARTWAADYPGCEATVAQGKAELVKAKRLSSAENAILIMTLIENDADCGNYPKGEKHCKEWLALPQNTGTATERDFVLKQAVLNLTKQNKLAEARQYQKQIKSGGDYDFITDEEREVTAEIEKRRASRH